MIAIAAALALVVGLVIWAPWSSKTSVASPVGVTAGPVTTSSVTLHWSRPATGPVPDRYVILRGGKEVGSVPGTVTAYRDTGLVPVTTYQYGVAAVVGGDRSHPTAAPVVRTSTPPVSAARLQGSWPVHIKVVKSAGGSLSVGRTMTENWLFTPKCATGPCAVVATGNLGSHPFTVTLNRAGAVYTGSGPAHITHCGLTGSEVDVRNTVQVRLTVAAAALSNQAWSARSWTGTMVLSSPYTSAGGTLYCPAQSVTASVAASR